MPSKDFRPKLTVLGPFTVALISAFIFPTPRLLAQDVYTAVPGWGQQLPPGVKWGETSGMAIDAKGHDSRVYPR